MSKRLDIMAPRKSRDGKTFWTRIGTAWEGDKGIQLVFDALPISDDQGRVVANLFEPRERNDTPRNERSGARQYEPASQFDEGGDPPF
jgi:hypothetical protein